MTLDKIDVTRDIMEMNLVLNSDEDPEFMRFYVELESWSEEGMNITYNFTHPLLVSKGIHPDYVLCKIIERRLFQAKASNATLTR